MTSLALTYAVVLTLQPRTFMELRQLLSELDLPESTREAWDQLF